MNIRMCARACVLAWRDYAHEGLLSACSVLSLAAVLAPLLVLYGVKFGVIGAMTERLISDPRTLEISPVGSGHFSATELTELAARPEVSFVLPRTRAIAATMELSAAMPEDANQRTSQPPGLPLQILVSLEPTGKNDPLLARHLPIHSVSIPSNALQGAFSVVLSASAATKLRVKPGDALRGKVERLNEGRPQSARVALIVAAVLPLEAQQKDVAFIPLPLLEATEDYRDGRQPAADPRLAVGQGWTGEARPDEPRIYPGFRLYARTLADVAVLRTFFESHRVEVYTQAEQIAAVASLDRSLTLIFGLVGTAAGLGFVASTASNALAGVRRKERHLGILRLVGFPAPAIMTFPLVQGLLTGFLGTALAVALYGGTALIIDQLFGQSLHGVEHVCALLPAHLFAALGLVQGLTLLATWLPAARAARIEPSEVIRDV